MPLEVPVSNVNGNITLTAAPYEAPISKQSNSTSARPYDIPIPSTNRKKLATPYEVPVSSEKPSVTRPNIDKMGIPYEVDVLQF